MESIEALLGEEARTRAARVRAAGVSDRVLFERSQEP